MAAPATAPLTLEALSTLVRGGCAGCGRNHLVARALHEVTLTFLTGEPSGGGPLPPVDERFAARVYQVACGECRAVLWERGECPGCGAAGGLSRALGGQHGLPRPDACPACGHEELRVTASARLRALFVNGHVSRRVREADPHEPGFHVVRIDCPACERTVAEAGAQLGASCALCGRSGLLRRRGPAAG